MNSLLSFLSRYEIPIFTILGIVILIYGRKVYLAWKDWTSALFGLEKEHSQQKFNQGLTILVFSILIAGGLFIVNTFITPSVPGIQSLATPTIDLTQQPSQTAPVPLVETTAQGLIPTITAYLSRGCIPDQIDWTDPKNSDAISGQVEVKGTVNVNNLGFYKYEYTTLGSDSWTTIAAGNAKIIQAPLGGIWDTSSLTPGDYELRLVVTDNQNNALTPCVIQVTIKATE